MFGRWVADITSTEGAGCLVDASRERSSATAMLFFSIKQMLRLRQAIFGRREPHALAWGVAVGVAWGLIPHGNLVAILLLLVIFSLYVNHGMAALTALVTTLLAGRLDPWSHAVGRELLTRPGLQDFWSTAWGVPLVPWTDLNNTVVLGSTVIAMGVLLPTYLLSYPIFHWLAPRPASESGGAAPILLADENAMPLGPDLGELLQPDQDENADEEESEHGWLLDIDDHPNQPWLGEFIPANAPEPRQERWVDTRIEVVRMRSVVDGQVVKSSCQPASMPNALSVDPTTTAMANQAAEPGQSSEPPQPEAPVGPPVLRERPPTQTLNYLLGQLRESKDGRAA